MKEPEIRRINICPRPKDRENEDKKIKNELKQEQSYYRSKDPWILINNLMTLCRIFGEGIFQLTQ